MSDSLASWRREADQRTKASRERRHSTHRRSTRTLALRGALTFLAVIGCVFLIAQQVV